MNPRIIFVGCAALLTASCSGIVKNASGVINSKPFTVTTLDPPAPLPQVEGEAARARANWGLALSGGGIRSATFSIGVMKALYDAGLMDSIGVVSSVSGGGYASYWLFRQQLDAVSAGSRFGANVFADSMFDKSVCELGSLGSFQTFGQIAAALVNSDSFDRYQWAIRRSFGFDEDVHADEPRLDLVLPMVKQGLMPTFILNATIDAPDRGKFRNVLEISPGFFGSPSTGYHHWTTGDSIPSWSQSVAIAGAAVPPLKQFLPNFAATERADSLRLWDGGESENLGALALIRRHIPNIVIVDSEHDPNYGFAGYLILKQLLPQENFSIEVPAIETFLAKRQGSPARLVPTAVSRGLIVYAPAGAKADTSNVFYVKLARTRSINAMTDTASAPYLAGEAYQSRIDSLVNTSRATGGPRERCRILAGHADGFRREAAMYNVAKFARLMEMLVSEDLARRGPATLRYDFPQTTTILQSYSSDQLRAFVGLGYLEGLQVGELASGR